MTERLHFHFSLSCIGEGNGNPLQCSCLESPRDGGAWWAAISGVAQSWTRLKRLSSSSSSSWPDSSPRSQCFMNTVSRSPPKMKLVLSGEPTHTEQLSSTQAKPCSVWNTPTILAWKRQLPNIPDRTQYCLIKRIPDTRAVQSTFCKTPPSP